MSKIGKLPITIGPQINVTIGEGNIEVKGPKGVLKFNYHRDIDIQLDDGKIKVIAKKDNKFTKALHGLTRSLVNNMVTGVQEGHQKILELVGTGYRAATSGDSLVLNVGYSHQVVFPKTPEINLEVKDNKIIVAGVDKALVGEVAAKIRRIRPPEPYKGKGIKYLDEVIRRKPGKAQKAQGSV